MASHTWILLCCILLSAVLGSQGIEFSISRTPGDVYCARVRCSNEADHDSGSFCNTKLTIYEINQAGIRVKLASISSKDQNLFIEPAKRNDVNGTGRLSQYHAQVTLDFRQDDDCEDGTFQCEAEFVNEQGKQEVLTETVSPGGRETDCGCPWIKDEFARLTTRGNEADRQVTVVRQRNGDLDTEIAELRQNVNAKEKDIARLKRNSTVFEGAVNLLRQSDKDTQDELAALRQVDQVTENALAELQRNDKVHDESFADLRHSDEVHASEISVLIQHDSDIQVVIYQLSCNDSKFQDDLNAVRLEDQAITNRISQVRRNITVLQADIKDVKEADESIENEISELDRTNKDQNDAIAVLKHTDVVNDQEISQLQQVDVALWDSIRVLSERDLSIAAALNSRGQSDQRIQQELATLQSYDNETLTKVAALQDRDDEIRVQITHLKHNDTILQQQIDDLKDNDRVYYSEINTLKSNDVLLASEITTLRQTTVVLDERVDRESQTYSELEREATILRQQQAALERRAAELSDTVTVLKVRLNNTSVRTVTTSTSTLVQATCLRGAKHTSPREAVLLYGTYQALCDTETDDGGWIVIQRRATGQENFYRSWKDYENGFGTVQTDYYLGNDLISRLTSAGYSVLRIELVYKGKSYWAQYSIFKVGGAASNYKLTVSGYSGNAGDSLTYHDGMDFSTFDNDNDKDKRNCAEVRSGAWWYNCCCSSNLNGKFGSGLEGGIIWKTLSKTESMSFVEMKVRAA